MNIKPKLQVLRQGQIETIHRAALEILEKTGVKLTHAGAAKMLSAAGAKVSGDRVRIPAAMVEQALKTAPKRVVLGTRDGKQSVFLEGDRSWHGPSIDCIDYLDPVTGERSRFSSKHCEITARLADALPNYTWVMTIGMAGDAPPMIADRIIARKTFENCTKPLVFCCRDENSLRDIHEMAICVSGDKAKFDNAPTIVHYSEPISPLVHYDPAVDKLIYCARHDLPLIYFPAPQAGSTAPATMAAVIALGSAESLSGLVLSQLVKPGAPFIYGALATVMDMQTTIFSYGAPEMSLMVAALSQMAQHYGLPFFGTAGCSDAKTADAQAAAEAAFSCLSSALVGANLVHDHGWIDHGAISSPAQMVLSNEILSWVNHFMRGVPCDEESLALDLIDRVGPGGHFLTEDHTLAHFRDVFYSKLFDRSIVQNWVEAGSKTFDTRLKDLTVQAMEHKPEPLPAKVIASFDAMQKKWK